LFSLGRSPAKHLFGLHRASVKSCPWDPEPHGAFQHRDPTPRRGPETHAVNPLAIHSNWRRLSPHRSLPRSVRFQFCADLPSGRMLQIVMTFRGYVGRRHLATAPNQSAGLLAWPNAERGRWSAKNDSLRLVGA